MKIGELSRRTGVPPRMLRYYEQQGLLRPARGQNGYRCYAPSSKISDDQLRRFVGEQPDSNADLLTAAVA